MCLLPSPFGHRHKWWKPRGVSSCRQPGWIPGEGKGSRQETRSRERRWNDGVFLVLWCTRYRRLPAPSYVPPPRSTLPSWPEVTQLGGGADGWVWVAPVLAADIAGHVSVIKPRGLCAQNTRAFSITGYSRWIWYPDAVCVCMCVCFCMGLELGIFFGLYPVACGILVPWPGIELHVPSIRSVGS